MFLFSCRRLPAAPPVIELAISSPSNRLIESIPIFESTDPPPCRPYTYIQDERHVATTPAAAERGGGATASPAFGGSSSSWLEWQLKSQEEEERRIEAHYYYRRSRVCCCYKTCFLYSFFSFPDLLLGLLPFGLLPLVLCIRLSQAMQSWLLPIGASTSSRGEAGRPTCFSALSCPALSCPSLPKRSLRGPKYRWKTEKKKVHARRHTNCSSEHGLGGVGISSTQESNQ